MNTVYIAYFDLLGFKEFISNNDDEHLNLRMDHIFIQIESSLAKGEIIDREQGGFIADISNSTINCLNISDTIVFWTNDCSIESLIELIEVSYEFNWRINNFEFPMRGCILKGKLNEASGRKNNKKGGVYSIQCLFGKGIIDAHLKAESQNWAGTIIDESIIYDLNQNKNGEEIIENFMFQFDVPLKNNLSSLEYVFRLYKGDIEEDELERYLDNVDNIFNQDNKSSDNPSVKQKIDNTKQFITISTQKT